MLNTFVFTIFLLIFLGCIYFLPIFESIISNALRIFFLFLANPTNTYICNNLFYSKTKMEEHSVYIIKKGETLESIAKNLRVNVDDLVEYHNAHTSDFISNDKWGLFMTKELCIPKDLTNMRLANVPDIIELGHDNTLFNCNDIVVDEISEMKLKGQDMLQAQIMQRYSVEKSYTDNRVLCTIDRREILKRQISPMYRPLANALTFLGRPLDRLTLGINPDGAIAKVVNQEEISEQWQQLKQTDEAQALLTDQTLGANIEQAMDADYSQSLDVVNKTLKYRLLCPDMFNRHFFAKMHMYETDLQLPSNFFASNKIRFTLNEEYTFDLQADTLSIHRRYEAVNEMQQELLDVYRSSMQDYLQCPMDYKMSIDCIFMLSYSNFQIQNTACHLQEELNNSAIFINDIHIMYNNSEQQTV